jgi:non-heme chloroperoxidase
MKLVRIAAGPAVGITLTVRTPDGLSISAQEWGNPDGPEIIFVHGFMQSHLSWTKQVNSELSGEFRIITYDFRGHGGSDKPMDSSFYHNGERFADELAAVIETTKLKKPVLVGWSYGTRISSDYLTKYGTGRLAGINYVGSAQGSDSSLMGPGAAWIDKALNEELASNIQATRQFVRACFAKQPAAEEYEVILSFNSMVPAKIRGWLRRPSSYENALKAVNVPFLISHGTDDQICRLDMAKYVASLVPNAATSYYEGVGHSPFWEEPQRFNSELAAFVRRANQADK